MNTQLTFFLLKLKNAALYKKESVIVHYKKEYLKVLHLLYKEGYVQHYSLHTNSDNNSFLIIHLRHYNNVFALSNLKLLSKQSCIRTIKYKHLTYNIYDVRKTFFITTNQGLKTQLNCKQNKLGGSLVFMC